MPGKPVKKLLIVSSESGTGDAEGPPELKKAASGPLGSVRALHESAAWPAGLELVIVSNSYGLVEPLNEAVEPVPVPFSRQQNPGWWADFITHNLSRLLEKRVFSAVLVLPNPHHEQALRHCGKLQELDTVWGNPGVAGLAGAELLRAWLSGKARAGRKRTSTTKPPATTTDPTALTVKPVEPALAEQDLVPIVKIIQYPTPTAQQSVLIEEAIYSDRFMLVVGQVDKQQTLGIEQALKREWAQRRSKGRGRKSVSNLVVKMARLPWSHRPAATLSGRLLESIGMPAILGSINKAVAQVSITEPGRYREILARIPEDESEFMTDVLHLLWEASSRMDKDEIALLRAYLTDECTPAELRRIGLPRNLRLEDRYEILHTVVKCFIGLSPEGVLSDYRRVWIWLDEIENILGYDERERWETVKALETMFADKPMCLTIWLNITPGRQATTETIQKALENNLPITDDLTNELKITSQSTS